MRLYLSSFRNGNHPEELSRLLHGPRTALIANAGDYGAPEDRRSSTADELQRLRSIGLEPQEVDLRQYFGRTGELSEQLRAFDLLWIRGGNVFVLRRALRQSGADDILRELLAQDLVAYGGYSAGGCVLTPSLRGIEMVDDPMFVPSGYPSEVVWDGLGILPYAFVPHYRSDHSESADIERLAQHYIDSHVPFVALRDGEAIIVSGAETRVVG